ncbi:MAG: hemolysin family protein [Crocinitomicaceae bacterium]|nr:hemolysin family protein [Crocinitomicaceae bacterium]MDG1776769.1 hemolysin family protein [Crocinitomicaceae bacterium]
MEGPLIGIIITLIFSAFFSGMEIAYISSNRLKIELDKSKGTIKGKILGIFYKHESHFIAMLLLGNNIALVFFGLFSADMLEGIIASWGITGEGLTLLLQTTLSTALVLVTAEFLPKTFVQMNPNGYLRFATAPMILIYGVLYIPTYIVLWLSSIFLRILNVDSDNSEKVFSKIDLEDYVHDINERISDEQELGNEVQILQNALDFDSVKARDCMIPRTDIISVSVEDEITALGKKFIDSGKSKIVVYRENIDDIIGYVHSFEMFKSPESIKQILLPIPFVPEATPGKELLELFTEKSGNIAVVVDEYGGTAGIVTIEDVIEEIFGEIEDEHDKEEFIEERISKTEYRFSARLDIDYLNEAYEFELPTSEAYETLGGMIIDHLASIPEAGTMIELERIKMHIETVSQNRIEVVRLEK